MQSAPLILFPGNASREQSEPLSMVYELDSGDIYIGTSSHEGKILHMHPF